MTPEELLKMVALECLLVGTDGNVTHTYVQAAVNKLIDDIERWKQDNAGTAEIPPLVLETENQLKALHGPLRSFQKRLVAMSSKLSEELK